MSAVDSATETMRVPRKAKKDEDLELPSDYKGRDLFSPSSEEEGGGSISNNNPNIFEDSSSVNNNDSNDVFNTEGLSPSPKANNTDSDLPEGIILPPSVTSELLQGRLKNMLLQLPIDQINEALNEYDDAARIRGLNIRNHYAYFNGLLKRFLSVHEKVKAGLCEGRMGNQLSERVKERIISLDQVGYCKAEEIEQDDRVMAKLKLLSESEALMAFDELESVERTKIRNLGSYFMGIINRYMRGERGRKDSQNDSRKDNTRKKNEDKKQDSKRGRHSRHRSRSRSRSRSPDYDYHRYDKYSRRKDEYYSNDDEYYRNRDKYDRLADEYDRYDNRSRNHRNSSHRDRKDDHRHKSHKDRNYDSSRYDSQNESKSSKYFSRYQSTLPPEAGIASSVTPNSNYNMAQRQHYQSNFPGISVPAPAMLNQPAFQLPYHAPGQNPGINQTMYQAPSIPLNSMGTFNLSAPVQIPNQFQQPQLSQFQQPIVSHHSLNLLGSSAPPAAPTIHRVQPAPPQMHNQATPTNANSIDLLGIADMAQKVLESQHQPPPPPPPQQPQPIQAQPFLRTNPQAPISAPNPQIQPHNFQTNSYLNINDNSNVDVPIMVKLALQNLIATGHLEKELDQGLMRLLRKLPEGKALEALNNYASCDFSRVRNKTGYLGGILKKHVDKLENQGQINQY